MGIKEFTDQWVQTFGEEYIQASALRHLVMTHMDGEVGKSFGSGFGVHGMHIGKWLTAQFGKEIDPENHPGLIVFKQVGRGTASKYSLQYRKEKKE